MTSNLPMAPPSSVVHQIASDLVVADPFAADLRINVMKASGERDRIADERALTAQIAYQNATGRTL